jgi:hypothetical protein
VKFTQESGDRLSSALIAKVKTCEDGAITIFVDGNSSPYHVYEPVHFGSDFIRFGITPAPASKTVIVPFSKIASIVI